MPDIYHLSDFPSCVADCVDGMTGTDNTAAINSVIASLPAGSELMVSPHTPQPGSDAPGYGHVGPIVVDHPVNVKGMGMFSRFAPLAGFPTSAPNIHVIENGYYWAGITFSDFQIGTRWFQPPFTRNGGDGIFVDGASMPKMNWEKLLIGDSGNGHGLHITGVGTQDHTITGGTIDGGIHLDGVSDGFAIDNVAIGGRSLMSGILSRVLGSGINITRNRITAVGGVVVQSGSKVVIEDNYIEELPGFPINNYNNGGGYNGMVTLVGYPNDVQSARIVDNTINMGVSGAGNGFNVAGATGFCVNINAAVKGVFDTMIERNEMNISTNRGYINSSDSRLILGPNTYVQPSWAKLTSGSAAPAQIIGGG